MVERICLLTGNETRCMDSCYRCGCGGEVALNNFYVPIYTIQRVCDNVKDDCTTTEGAEVAEEIRNELEKMVVEKAADVQPVKHGYWEEVTDYGGWGDTHYRCSVCGEEWYLEDGKPKDNNMNFCPRCGAKMDAEPDEPWQSE